MARDPDLIGVRLTPDLLAALDAEVERQRAEFPDHGLNRSTVLRGIVRRALLPTPRPASALPASPPPSAAAPVEGPCSICGEGVWAACVLGCGARTRTCGCVLDRDGACESCASKRPVSPAAETPANDPRLLVTPRRTGAAPPPASGSAPRASSRSSVTDPFAPDDEQAAARAEVLAWRAGDPAASRSRTRTNQALATACGMASESGIRGWLAGARLRASDLAAVLKHVRGGA